MKSNRKGWWLFYVLALFLGLLSVTAQEGISLTIEVQGGSPKKGQAIISLFTSADNYLKEPTFSKIQPIDANGKSLFTIDNLTKGKYAVSVIYDKDNNGELNTGFLGIPKELVGFSNNVKGNFGPPTFDKTSFELSKSKKITIFLGKAKD